MIKKKSDSSLCAKTDATLHLQSTNQWWQLCNSEFRWFFFKKKTRFISWHFQFDFCVVFSRSKKNVLFFREVKRTAGVSTTDLVGRMLLMTRTHFRRGEQEYEVCRNDSSFMGLDSTARSPYTGCSQFLPTTQKISQFSEGKEPKVNLMLFVLFTITLTVLPPPNITE